MRNVTDESLAQSRAYGTTEERMVLAIESIADQIRSLVKALVPNRTSEEDLNYAAASRAAATDEGAWENEGGRLDTEAATNLGINHGVTDQFETGGYRYTKLADAIAEAKRARARSTA